MPADRESTCDWDCVLRYPHDGPCASVVRVLAELDALRARLRTVEQQAEELSDIHKLAKLDMMEDVLQRTKESATQTVLRLYASITTLRVELAANRGHDALVQKACDTAVKNLERAEQAEAALAQLEQELAALRDLPLAHQQVFNDGVPENTEQALRMWHRAAHNQANRADKAEAALAQREQELADTQKRLAIVELSVPMEDELSWRIDEMLKYLAMRDGFTLAGIAQLFATCQRRIAADWNAIGDARRRTKAAEAELAALQTGLAQLEQHMREWEEQTKIQGWADALHAARTQE